MYEYGCRMVRVIDGDTVEVDIDLGFKIHQRRIVRLYGVNTPELPTEPGKAAKAFTQDWLESAFNLVIVTQKDKADKYGRYLATFHDGGSWSDSLNDILVREGHTVEYMK